MNITIIEEPRITYTKQITSLVFKYGSHKYELQYVEDTHKGYFELYNELGEEIKDGILYEQLKKINVYNLMKSNLTNINLIEI